MSLQLDAIDFDCRDAARVGRFWAQLLGRELGGPDDDGTLWIEPGGGAPELLFLPVPEAKTAKNRVHLDLRPEDQGAEVKRALELGASHVDLGQREVSWVVLADPEGNEFCILRGRRPEEV